MNKKLIAAAVSAAVVAPVASQGADVSVYGNLTNAIVSTDNGEDTNSKATNVSTVGSRIGVKATSDLGNGMSAVARYEFGTTTDESSTIGAARHSYVGLSGGFGTFTIGHQSRAYNNAVTGNVSPNYTAGVPVGGPGKSRTGNTLKYANNLGVVNFGLDVRVDDEDDSINDEGESNGHGTGFSVGVSLSPLDNLNIGIGYDSTDEGDAKDQGEEDSAVGISAKYDFGPVWVSGGYQVASTHSGEAAYMPAVVGVTEVTEVTAVTAVTAAPGVAAVAAVTGVAAVAAVAAKPAKFAGAGPINTTADTTTVQLYVGGKISDQTAWDVGVGMSTTELEGDKNDNEVMGVALALSHNVGGGLVFFLEHKATTTNDGGIAVSAGVLGVDDRPAQAEVEVDTSATTLGMRLTF